MSEDTEITAQRDAAEAQTPAPAPAGCQMTPEELEAFSNHIENFPFIS